MSTAILITVPSDVQALVLRYQGAQPIIRRLIRQAVDEENLNTVSHILETKLTAAGPKFLNVQTGRLRRSVRATAAAEVGGFIRSTIGSNLVYAAAHEFGAKAHKIVARNAKALRFQPVGQGVYRRGKGFIFRKSANIPALPARAPIRTGILECADNYSTRAAGLIRREFGRES